VSSSLRDQLLKAGLINKKQANEVERQQQKQERRPPPKSANTAAPARNEASHKAQAAKLLRDQELNRRQQQKAEKKALHAQIKQLIEQNRLATPDGEETYNFVDGTKIRRIAVNAPIRERLTRGEIVIVHHDARYDLVPAAIAERIKERDERAVVSILREDGIAKSTDEYQGFAVPDDLMW
jgi:uncharacterized protein